MIEKTFRVRCTSGLHRIVWDGSRYSAPDHSESDHLLDAFQGKEAKCEQIAREANYSLCDAFPFTCNKSLNAHVKKEAKLQAYSILRAAELPFPPGGVVAMHWWKNVQHLGTADRSVIMREPSARSLVGRALIHRTQFSEIREKEGVLPDHGWRIDQKRDGRASTIALWDSCGRVVLWHDLKKDFQFFSSHGSYGAYRWSKSPHVRDVSLANLALAVIHSYPCRCRRKNSMPSERTVRSWSRRFREALLMDPMELRETKQ